MSAQIRPTRLEVSDRFPMLGFNIRTDGPPQRAEVVLASDPSLFGADGKTRRTAANFYSSRAGGPVPVMRGEAMFVVPPEVLARFVGNEKIYFGLATAPDAGGPMEVAVKPSDASPYISLKGLTERSMRRVRVLPNRQQRAAGYGKGGQSALEWAGDVATPGMEPARANGGAAPAANGGAKTNGGKAPAPEAVPYDDGFGPMPAKAAAPAGPNLPPAPAQSLGGRGRLGKALTIGPDDVEKAQRYAPNWADLFNWSAPAGVVSEIEGRGMSVQRIQDAAGELNLDRYEVEISGFPGGWDAPKLLEHFRTHINDFLDTRNTEFIPYDSSDGTRWLSSSPLGTVFKLDIVGPDNAAVVVSAVEPQYFRVTTIHTEWSGDHPVSGHREFGYSTRGDKTVFYTRGADRATDGILETIVFAGADHLWKSFQSKLSGWVNDNGGSATAPEPFSERFHPKVVQILYGTSQSRGLAREAFGRETADAGEALPLTPPPAPRARSLDARRPVSAAMVVGLEDRQKARKYARDFIDLFQWSPSSSVVSGLTARGFSVQTLDAAVGDLNLDFYKVLIKRFPAGLDAPRLLQQFIRDINSFINTTYCEFFPYDDSDAQLLASSNQLGTVLKIDMLGPDNAAIVISDVKPQFYAVTTINTPWSGDHPVSGHRQFGYFVVDGNTTFYTRGADRTTLGFPGTEMATFKGGELLWQSFQEKMAAFINEKGGEAEVLEPFSERFDAQAIREEFGHFDVTQSLAMARAQSGGTATKKQRQLDAPPYARARALGGGADAATAIGGFLLETVRDSQGDVTWELDQFAQRKHPNDVAPANPAPYRDAPTIRLDNWPVSGGLVDDISAWFSIDWQFNGTSLGNVRISNIGTNDAVGWGLHVRAQIMDDNILYPPNQCAALRIRFHYRFNRSIGSDVLAQTDVHIYGDGTYETSSQWLQSSTLALSRAVQQKRKGAKGYGLAAGDVAASGEPLPLADPPPPRARALARAMDGGVSAAIAVAGFILTSIRDSEGDVTWDLDQFPHLKHPNDVAPANPASYRDAATIRLDSWPVSGGLVDDISAWFSIDWQCNGTSLGNVRISNIGTNDAVGWGLSVRAQIMDDNILYPPNQCAALRIRFHYRFNRSIGSDVLAQTDIHLYGDGTYETNSQWLQSSALALSNGQKRKDGRGRSAYARGFDADQPHTIGSDGGISWDLAQYPGMKASSSMVAATGTLNGDTVTLADWPYIDEAGGTRTQAALTIDWKYDASGAVGAVRVALGPVKAAPGRTLNVVASVDDAPGTPSAAALQVTIRYTFRHATEGEQVAVTGVRIYGDGTHEITSKWQPLVPLGLGYSGRGARETAKARAFGLTDKVGEIVLGRLLGPGDVKWQLDSFTGPKHPNDQPPANPAPFRQAPTINIRDWERGMISDCSADFDIDWQFNGKSIGPIDIKNVGFDDAVAWNLSVRATISHDNIVYDHRFPTLVILSGVPVPLLIDNGTAASSDPNRQPCAAMKIRFDFDFTQWPVGPPHKGVCDIVLYGDGTYVRRDYWLQDSFL